MFVPLFYIERRIMQNNKQFLNELQGEVYCNMRQSSFEVLKYNDDEWTDDLVVAQLTHHRGEQKRYFISVSSLKNCQFVDDHWSMHDCDGHHLEIVSVSEVAYPECNDELDSFTDEEWSLIEEKCNALNYSDVPF